MATLRWGIYMRGEKCPAIKISLQKPALILLLLVHMVCLELAAVQSTNSR